MAWRKVIHETLPVAEEENPEYEWFRLKCGLFYLFSSKYFRHERKSICSPDVNLYQLKTDISVIRQRDIRLRGDYLSLCQNIGSRISSLFIYAFWSSSLIYRAILCFEGNRHALRSSCFYKLVRKTHSSAYLFKENVKVSEAPFSKEMREPICSCHNVQRS